MLLQLLPHWVLRPSLRQSWWHFPAPCFTVFKMGEYAIKHIEKSLSMKPFLCSLPPRPQGQPAKNCFIKLTIGPQVPQSLSITKKTLRADCGSKRILSWKASSAWRWPTVLTIRSWWIEGQKTQKIKNKKANQNTVTATVQTLIQYGTPVPSAVSFIPILNPGDCITWRMKANRRYSSLV